MIDLTPPGNIPLPDTEGGKSRFRTNTRRIRSPLTTKILAFNLVALSLLVTGILFLNQSQDSLIALREKTLEDDTRMLANALSLELENLAYGEEEGNFATAEFLDLVSAPLNSDVQFFTAKGQPIILPESGAGSDETGLAERTNELDDILSDAWRRIALVFRSSETGGLDDPAMILHRSDIAQRVVFTGNLIKSSVLNARQQSILTVGAPVFQNGEIAGAVILSTASGEVDSYIRAERQQILKVFMLAIFISVVLSILLANTIGRPLRLLTDAAEKGSDQRSGRVSPVRVNIPDLTARPDEIGDLSRQMRNMTTALYDRIEANAAFAADVAHEIKNPLTSLGQAVETMRYAKDDKSREKLLDVIEDDVRRMDRLVTDISNASRLDAELAKDELQEIDIAKMLTDLAEYQDGIAQDKGVSVIADMPERPTIIHGNESRLAQVFVNLISNAVSFVESGGWVKVTGRQEDRQVRIMVEDTGVGIPKDNLEDVFKRFYSNRPEQEFGNNSGLGLAISKQIVEAHGGNIWAENIYPNDDEDADPTGARFVVILPV